MAISPHVTSRMKSTCRGRGARVAGERDATGEHLVSGAAVTAAVLTGGVLGARAAGVRRRAYGGGSAAAGVRRREYGLRVGTKPSRHEGVGPARVAPRRCGYAWHGGTSARKPKT